MSADRFDYDVTLAAWLFTVALGVGLGLVVSGALLGVRRRLMLVLCVAGLGIVVTSGLLVVDQSPISFVEFRLKPYLTDAVEAGVLGLAFAVGVGVALAMAVGGRRLAPRTVRGDAIVVTGLVAVATVITLALMAGVDAGGRGRHPPHDRRIEDATLLIGHLNIPTGLAIGPSGQIVVVEFGTASVSLFEAQSGGDLVRTASVRLPAPENGMAFHVALHPDFPAQPFAYVSSEAVGANGNMLRVFRVRLEAGIEPGVDAIGPEFPIAPATDTNHWGTSVAFCGEYFFISTGDGDPYARTSNDDERHAAQARAQQLTSGYGKIMRFRLERTDLVADGVLGDVLPIFAQGFRNPFGMDCDDAPGELLVTDNGAGSNDQIRRVAPGGNHEWPFSDERRRLNAPVFDSGRVRMAPTGLAHRGVGEATEYFLSAFQSAALYRFRITPAGKAARFELVREVEGGAFSVAAGSDGCIYYGDAESIWRLDDEGCPR